MRHHSRHQLVLSLLALAEAATLLTGAAAAATVAVRPAVAGGTVHATQAVAPQVVTVQPAEVVRPVPQRPRVHHAVAPRHPSTHRAPRATVRRTVAKPVQRAVDPLTLMEQSVARIPGYHPGDAAWVMTSRFGHWGIADLTAAVIYIAPNVPSERMYDVVAHEWSHVLSVKAYGGDVDAAVTAMNSYFGGTGLEGAEKAADCMALELGARWTHYTSCQDSSWRAGARRLLARQRL